MLVSAEWILHLLEPHPSGLATVRKHLQDLPRSSTEPGTGDTVVCVDAGDVTAGADGATFVHGRTYRVTNRSTAHVMIEGVPGLWDAARFRAPVRGVDPLSALLTAIDRGSWAEVLLARKALDR